MEMVYEENSMNLKVKSLSCSACPDNWHEHGGKCYSLSQVKKPWSLAEEHCSLLGVCYFSFNPDFKLFDLCRDTSHPFQTKRLMNF